MVSKTKSSTHPSNKRSLDNDFRFEKTDFGVKRLRSAKPGEQCEAIVRFPRLFEKYPFPILINSAFLKLADLFRVGSNFLRHCILKVTQQSEKHLDRILNVDEFLRRIYMVMHSNDPVARAITLSIINGLDSRDAVEQEAAIFAALCFAAQSKNFANGICTKLEEMIKGLVTPVGMKLKLIPIFQHMHHDASMAKKVELLIQYLVSDSRKAIKIMALKDLLLLAHQSPHVWSENNIQVLCKTGLSTPYCGLKIGILKVLTALSGSVAVAKFSADPESEVLLFCNHCCYDTYLLMSAYGAQLFTHIAIHRAKGGDQSLVEDCGSVLDMMITLTNEPDKNADSARNIATGQGTVFTVLLATRPERLSLCHCLSALGSHHGDMMPSLVPDLLATLVNTSVVTLLLQATVCDGLSEESQSSIEHVLDTAGHWSAYKIARQATRYGHHHLASLIFGKLVNKVSSEHYNFWLTALKECCHGETCLHGNYTPTTITDFVKQVSEAEIHYHNGISALKAASTPTSPLEFHISYLENRTEMLEVLLQVVQVCCSFQTSPPPAIATSLAMTTRQDSHRCKHVVDQVTKDLPADGSCFGDSVCSLSKLAISPQPRSQNEPITVHYDTCLTLKVEGIIQHGKACHLYRTVKYVKLLIKSSQQSKTPSLSEGKVHENPTNDMVQTAEPSNDYFSINFLLSFPVPGLHLVELRKQVVDDSGATWCMGMPVKLLVKSYDEAVQTATATAVRSSATESSNNGWN
ncbi:hypothetical protein LSH36_405g02019 [Paralvinella palmiformis]|uniref:Integrator complex subunit 7 n=1 Tax=Paralvinella palmiformis TaxID=53620 RepID=A0AAD9JD63_9ANNE|nr:hypothetical protein LSH36_405g02019 [Paralvinella palmiformis]